MDVEKEQNMRQNNLKTNLLYFITTYEDFSH